ncbi:MAG: hypothetical protein EOP33_02620 [Rickettsiaceae bacterium]|nr:MAG: hypothetical protein EOP33_02620 [Rickettsiaceae bacterium]
MNEQVLEKVIKSNPSIKTKEQGLRWMKENPIAASAIAKSVIATNNPFGKNSLSSNKHTQGILDQTRFAGDSASKVNIGSSQELKDKHNQKESMEQPVITGSNKPQVVAQDVDKALDHTLIDSERYVVGELNNMPSEINDQSNKLKQKFKDGSKSTAVRVAVKVGDNIMDSIRPNKGDENE